MKKTKLFFLMGISIIFSQSCTDISLEPVHPVVHSSYTIRSIKLLSTPAQKLDNSGSDVDFDEDGTGADIYCDIYDDHPPIPTSLIIDLSGDTIAPVNKRILAYTSPIFTDKDITTDLPLTWIPKTRITDMKTLTAIVFRDKDGIQDKDNDDFLGLISFTGESLKGQTTVILADTVANYVAPRITRVEVTVDWNLY